MNKLERYVKAPIEILDDDGITPRDVQVYLMLRSYRNEKERSRVYPSRSTLAKRLRCSVDTVDTSIKRLVRAGWIVYRKGNMTRSNEYIILSSPSGSRKNTARVAENMPPQPEPYNNIYNTKKNKKLYHGRDQAFFRPDGEIAIIVSGGHAVPWSGGDEESFRYGELRGKEARLEAARAHGNNSSAKTTQV